MWRKGEIARNEQFLLFQQCFPSVWRTFSHFLQVNKKKKKNGRLQTLPLWKSLEIVVWERANSYQESICYVL